MVVFDEMRDVFVNGFPHGRANTLLQLSAGTYDITLGPPEDFTPPSREVRLQSTAPTNPCRVEFRRLTASPAAPSGTPA